MSLSPSSQKYQDLVNECDRLIKAGLIGQVAVLIKELNSSNIPRPFRQQLAKICRRAGLIHGGLRILHPIIRAQKKSEDPATAAEICEYAVLLSRNGSIQEALTLLQDVSAPDNPEAMLYTGYCHISNWDYAKSVDYIERFLNSSADDYSKLIARVNLISSYVVISELDKAAELLQVAIPVAEQAGATRLVGNCFELWGQVHFWRGDFTAARQSLKKAEQIFGNTQTYDQLLMNKTEAIMLALETNSADPLLKFRKDAVLRKHRESVREADLFLLKVNFEQRDMDHLIFGTPMLPYRARIQQVLQASPSETYLLGNAGARTLDLNTGKLSGQKIRRSRSPSAELNPGKKIHQVLSCLVKDFYVPRNIGTLFSDLYPDEFFDINSSPFRVRQLMMRTRQWMKEHSIPASIVQSESTYSLLINEDFGIKLSLQGEVLDSLGLRWQELQRTFSLDGAFTAEQACERLRWSRTSFRRIVDWAMQKNYVQKSGHGKSIHYTFPASLNSLISVRKTG